MTAPRTRRLILMRHAKSAWDDPALRDFDRPLNKRGRAAAPRIGAWLLARGYLPDEALVSPSARTRETWARLGERFGPVPMRAEEGLYHARPEAMLATLRTASPQAGTVLMLGHQPGIGLCAMRLLAEPPASADFDRYPTAATAVIEFDAPDWASVAWGGGRLAAFVIPAMLEA